MYGKEPTKESAIGGHGREIGKIVSPKKEKQVNRPRSRSKRVDEWAIWRLARIKWPVSNNYICYLIYFTLLLPLSYIYFTFATRF
jgi:hypothetical protein